MPIRELRPCRSASDATATAVPPRAAARPGRTPRLARTAATLSLSLLAACLAACGDAETARRVDADRAITEIASEYRRSIATRTADSADRTAGELTALLARAGSIAASGTQQSAASVLAANIALALAGVEAERSRDYESTIRQARSIVANAAEAAAALAAVADAQAGLTLSSDRTLLQARRAEAEASLRAAQQAARQLEDPVAALSAAAVERRQAVTALEQQAEELRRQANAVDAMAGFPLIETRAGVLEQVREARTALSLEELALASMRPELDVANAMLVANQALVSAADNALSELDNFASTLRGDADRSRTESDRLRKAADETLARLRELQSGPLAQSYERAMSALDQAASQAGRASGELGSIGARTKLSAESMRAALLAQQAASAEQDALLHARLAAASTLFGGEAKQRPEMDAATTRRTELVEAAKGSLTGAIEMLDQMPDNQTPALMRGRAALQGTLAVLEGRVDAAPAPGSATTPGSAGASAPRGSTYTTFGPGFPSSDALLAAFQAAESDPSAGMQAGRRGLAVSRREFADLLRLGFAVGEDMAPLLTAVTERFGAEAAMGMMSGMSSGPGGAGGIPNVTYKAIERDGRRILAAVASTGETTELELVQVGNAWYAVADAVFKDADPAMLAQVSQMGPMMEMMRGPMKAAFAEVAQKVRAGEISSAEQIEQALMEAMARQMGGFGGG